MKSKKFISSKDLKIFVLWIFFFLFCKDDSSLLNNLQIQQKQVEGNWTVVPSELGEKLIMNPHQDSYLIYNGDRKKEKIQIEIDSLGMQIYVGGISMGYFLFDEKGDKIWTGIWNNEIVSLKRFDY